MSTTKKNITSVRELERDYAGNILPTKRNKDFFHTLSEKHKGDKDAMWQEIGFQLYANFSLATTMDPTQENVFQLTPSSAVRARQRANMIALYNELYELEQKHADVEKKEIRTLIVEDDPTLRELFAELFLQEGWHVDLAADGFTSLIKLTNRYYDLIYMGIMMPYMDGIKVMRQLQSWNTIQGAMVVVSNLTADEVVKEAMEAGASYYLMMSKMNPTEIRDKFKSFLENIDQDEHPVPQKDRNKSV